MAITITGREHWPRAAKEIAAFIGSERFWRERVFKDQPEKLAEKLRQCDLALESLGKLVDQLTIAEAQALGAGLLPVTFTATQEAQLRLVE